MSDRYELHLSLRRVQDILDAQPGDPTFDDESCKGLPIRRTKRREGDPSKVLNQGTWARND